MNENVEELQISLPEQKNYEISYGLAYKLAQEKLSAFDDLEAQCHKSSSICQGKGSSRSILVNYLDRVYLVTLPDITIQIQNDNEAVELRDKILILHYLIHAKGTPLSNQLIAFKELHDGAAYFPTFFKRAIKPLIEYFGSNPEKLLNLSENMGGFKVKYGDIAVTIPAFNRIPITLVIWKGDDEFPPDANILFDSTILDYLPVEDVIVLCQTITWKLVNFLTNKNT